MSIAEQTGTAAHMTAAAAAWLESLTPAQRAKAAQPFTRTAERLRWYYTPTEQGGLPLGEMGTAAARNAHRLLASGLSAPGYALAATVIGLENVLDAAEGWTMPYPGREEHSRGRDPQMYFFTAFGNPGDRAWGWRVCGHHLAVNYAVLSGRAVAGPLFIGARPATSDLAGTTLRPLCAAEESARRLLGALEPGQREIAVLSAHPPPDIVQANRPVIDPDALPLPLWQLFGTPLPAPTLETMRSGDAGLRAELGVTDATLAAVRLGTTPKGLAGASMGEQQQALLRDLIGHYLGRLPDEVAGPYAKRLRGPGLAATRFAWAGAASPGAAHYYRVQGPGLLIEYNNTQDGANHAHSVWRDPDGEFAAAEDLRDTS
jgi:Protein of unknown function (DUF3500)